MKYLLFYFLLPLFTNSQNPDPAVGAQLFQNKTLAWQKLYIGIWDEVIPVRLDLASDGEICKGFLYFGTDNKNKYVVSGRQIANELHLEEQDLHGNNTGMMALRVDGIAIKGTWYNATQSYNAPIVFTEGENKINTNYWVRSYAFKNDPSESQVLMHKDFSDQISTKFYYKLLNKTLTGTSPIKNEEGYAQEAVLADYLNNAAGQLKAWKINDKKLDVQFKLGNMEYSQSLELTNELPINQEVYADHWIAVDIAYPKVDKPEIAAWTRHIIDSFLNSIQDQKMEAIEKKSKDDRLLYRLSIWPQIDFLNEQLLSGVLHVKSSWNEDIVSIPYIFDLKKGLVLNKELLIENEALFNTIKNKILTRELKKLQSSASLDYQSLLPEDFTILTLKKEGLVLSAPFDLINGFRQIVIPYFEIREALSTKYFPL